VERHKLFTPRESFYLGDRLEGGPYLREYVKRFGRYTIQHFKLRDGIRSSHLLSERPEAISARAILENRSAEGRLRETRWGFKGGAGAQAGIQPCRIDRSSAKMISLAPRSKVTYAFAEEVHAAKWISVFGGFPDRATAWHRSPVHMTIESDNKALVGDFEYPNLSGMRGITFELPKGARKATVSIETTSPENPRFCFDALFWE
jgi:hypothetical protein